jgi:predicted amidophosphoribosyltransferase
MRKGILVTKKGTKEGYFPIFIDDREFVHSVLAEAMEQWKHQKTQDAVHDGMVFFGIANAIGKERTKSHQFIGAESISERDLEEGFNQASYIFAVDFKEGKVRKVK